MSKFLFLILFLLININIFSGPINQMNNKFNNKEKYVKVEVKLEDVFEKYKYEIDKNTKREIYVEFIESVVPEKFVKPFYEMTRDNINIGMELLGIGLHESEWKYFVGKKNKNGSVDLGPLMLNSYNINDSWFIEKYGKGLDSYKYDNDIYYMVLCINFWKSLRNTYGVYNALQVYNGGPRVMYKNVNYTLKQTVKKYANTVCEKINILVEDYNNKYNTEYDSKFMKKLNDIYRIEYNNGYTIMIVDDTYSDNTNTTTIETITINTVEVRNMWFEIMLSVFIFIICSLMIIARFVDIRMNRRTVS